MLQVVEDVPCQNIQALNLKRLGLQMMLQVVEDVPAVLVHRFVAFDWLVTNDASSC